MQDAAVDQTCCPSISAAPSLLLIVPSTTAQANEVLPCLMLAGLPLLRRIVLAAVRAGIERILVLAPEMTQVKHLLEGTPATTLTPDGLPPSLPAGRVVLLAANTLPQPQWLHALCELPLEPERLYIEATSIAVIDTHDARPLLAAVSRSRSPAEVFTSLREVFNAEDRRFDDTGRLTLVTSQDAPAAEDWLLRSLIKDTEGFMSRHVERRISLALTRRLAATPLTPNAMTFVSVGLGLLGASFFLSSQAAWQLTGALLFLAHSILDGCDGELARLKFLESRWGGLLDFWGDNVVHVAVFTCMAIGWSLASQALTPLLVGGIAVASTLLSAGLVYRHTMHGKAADAPLFTSVVRSRISWLSRLADALARRDFIYLVVVLSALGHATWFLILVAAGSPMFFLVLLWITRREGHGEGTSA